jgi:hypothetical protein
MARGRMLSKSFSTSARRGRLHAEFPAIAEFAQALYMLLIAHADDYGREPGDAFTVKHEIDPISPRELADFDVALGVLEAVGLITRYAVGRHQVIAVTDFDAHQAGLHKRTAPRFPEPPKHSGNFRERSGKSSSRARAEPNLTELKRTEQKGGTEPKGTEENGNEENPPAVVVDACAAVDGPPGAVPAEAWDRVQRLKADLGRAAACVQSRPRARRGSRRG